MILMKLITARGALLALLISVATATAAPTSSAKSLYQPFKNPAQAAQRLTRVLNAKTSINTTRCQVVNPYTIKCATKWRESGVGKIPTLVTFRKLNPYTLNVVIWNLAETTPQTWDTKVAY